MDRKRALMISSSLASAIVVIIRKFGSLWSFRSTFVGDLSNGGDAFRADSGRASRLREDDILQWHVSVSAINWQVCATSLLCQIDLAEGNLITKDPRHDKCKV